MKKLALTLLVALAAATAAVAVQQATPRSPAPPTAPVAAEAAGAVTAGQAEVRPGQIGYQQRRINYSQIRRASPLAAPQIGYTQSSQSRGKCATGACRCN